ncbi:MAG: ABC transporter permease [Oscillospiraceae bacterium]|jgi:simple sugar transport system permease protein|nr:ABC transporter permease [Oscillospiraceae bacterium]
MNKRDFHKKFIPIALALVGGFFVGGIFLAICGYNPISSYTAMIEGIFSRPKYIAQVIIKSTPLILTGLSVAFAFKCGLFNIGAEGQYMIGVMTATLVGTKLSLPPVVHFVVLLLLAAAAAGVWGAIAGLLKVRLGINEVVTSIMLNWIAFYLYRYIFAMPWLHVKELDASLAIQETGRSTILQGFKNTAEGRAIMANNSALSDILKTDLNFGIFVAILVIIFISYLLNTTTKGFEFRAMGINQEASRFVGMNVSWNMTLAMFIAGAIAGLAGILQVTGIYPYRMTNLAGFEGYGNEGIYIALVANCSPIGCLFSGLFFSAIKCGSTTMQSKVGTPSEIIKIITGLIIFFIAISFAYKLLIAKMKQRKESRCKGDDK